MRNLPISAKERGGSIHRVTENPRESLKTPDSSVLRSYEREASIAARTEAGAQYTVYTGEGRKRKTIYGKTRAEVGGKLAKALSDCQDGLVFDDEGLTLGKYLDKWLEGSLRGAVRQSTFDRYEIAVRIHIKPVLGRLKLIKLAPTHLAGFYQDKLAAGFAPPA
jgi:hypothetical protein